MKSIGFGLLCVALGSLVLVGGLASPAAADEAAAEATAEDRQPGLQKEATLEGEAEVLTIPLGLDTAPVFKAGCTTQACGNTGTKVGEGANCPAARADLISQLDAAAYEICPGTVISTTHHIGTCAANCDTPGNSDVVCKICPGESCGTEW